MLTFSEAASVAASPTAPIAPELQNLLQRRVTDWTETGVLALTHLVIVQPADTAADLRREITLCPLISPLDGSHFGSKDFQPFWDWLIRHDSGWFEMIVTVGNSGFAFVLFIEDAEGVDPDLLALCRAYAGVQP